MVRDGFTRKKVESLTLGEKLKKLRGDFRMSLTDVSKATRIQVKYLEFLENGEYEKLPADVYVRGFLRSYARYLNIDEQALVKLYERERNIRENLGHDTHQKTSAFSLPPASLVITSRSLILVLIGLLLFGSFFYLYREFQSFGSEPLLVVLSPENNSVIESNEMIVSGKTDRGAQVTINGQGVFVDSEGSFSEKLVLQPGQNGVSLRTINRFHKEKTVMLSIEARYTPEVVAIENGTPEILPDAPFRIEIAARSIDITLRVVADGSVVFQGILSAEERKNFEAKETLSISTDRGEATFIRRDDGGAEALSSKPGPVEEAVFYRLEKSPSTP